MSHSLEHISQLLEANVSNQEAQVFTTVQTGFDETVLIATADGYLRLAKALIDFVDAVQNRSGELYDGSTNGVHHFSSAAIGSIFHWLGEVQLDSTFLVQTEAEAEQLTRRSQQDSPHGNS